MDHIFSVKRKLFKGSENFYSLENTLVCSVSSSNVIAFTTKTDIEENNIRSYGAHVYVADLNSPWISHKVLVNNATVTVLQWDYTGKYLLVGDENGGVRIYVGKDHLLSDWVLAAQTTLLGEPILAAAFFHSGKKISLNPDKKDSSSYLEKFQHVKFACSVKTFGARPANGALLLTSTGLLCSIMLPQTTSTSPILTATESLGAVRANLKTADICYGKNGHFLLAVSSGDVSLPVQCYKVSVKRTDDKCVINSQSLPSFFLQEGLQEANAEVLIQEKLCSISHLKWVMQEDADSLVVALGSEMNSCLMVWELREKAAPVHKLFAGADQKYFNYVNWQYQSNFQYSKKVMSLATSKLALTNNVSSSYIVVAYSDNSIHCLYRDTLKPIASTILNVNTYGDEFHAKKAKTIPDIMNIDMSWLGNVLLVIDCDSYLHLFKLPPQIESSTPLSVPYATTMLEYCLVTGFDWLDLLLVLRPGMLDALIERITESYNRQNPAVQQFYYTPYLSVKTSLYRLSAQGQNKANDLTHFMMLNSISTAFKSLLRPSEMTAHDKSPADSLSSVIAEGQSDVDKVLIHLEAKEFTVEPSTLQSLQQLIQWVADLALNLLVRIPDSRPCASKPYEPLRDPKALNMLREMIVLIRIWGILLPPCLPVFTKSDASLDVLALVFRLLSRLVQTVNEPDDALIDECCLLPNQVQISLMHQQIFNNRVVLASPQLAQQILPLQLEFNIEPECLLSSSDLISTQYVDSIRHVYLGQYPRVIKQCVRCSGATGTIPVTRTAAIKAWDLRWIKSCQCGGSWRIQMSN